MHRTFRAVLAFAALTIPPLAAAHGGHADTDGFLHMLVHLFDVDHVLVAAGVGAVVYAVYRTLRQR